MWLPAELDSRERGRSSYCKCASAGPLSAFEVLDVNRASWNVIELRISILMQRSAIAVFPLHLLHHAVHNVKAIKKYVSSEVSHTKI